MKYTYLKKTTYPFIAQGIANIALRELSNFCIITIILFEQYHLHQTLWIFGVTEDSAHRPSI